MKFLVPAIAFITLSSMQVSLASQLTKLDVIQTVPTQSVFDVLATDDIENNLADLKRTSLDEINEMVAKAPKTQEEMAQALNSMLFPVHTPSLKPKQQPGHLAKTLHLPAPVAVIGNDPFSTAWLAINEQELLRIGASVMLVEVRNADEFNKIALLAPNLQIYPVSGLPLHDLHGLDFYPAVLTHEGIFQ